MLGMPLAYFDGRDEFVVLADCNHARKSPGADASAVGLMLLWLDSQMLFRKAKIRSDCTKSWVSQIC